MNVGHLISKTTHIQDHASGPHNALL
jgi:hypothetical protein